MLTARGDADGPHRRPGDGRRRLPAQAVRAARAAGAAARHPAPRRGRASGAALRFGRLEIDRDARSVQRRRRAAQRSPPTSSTLLVALAENAGRVLSREALMDLVKGEPLEAFDRSIDVHVSRIRQAIEDDPKKPRRIVTVRGAGYVFAKAQDQ